MAIRKVTTRNIMTIVIETVLASEVIHFELMNCRCLSSIWIQSVSKHSASSSRSPDFRIRLAIAIHFLGLWYLLQIIG